MSALPPSLTRVMTHALLVTTVAALLAALPAEPAWAAVPARCDDALPIAAGGDDMTYSLGPDASLWAWGNNYFGQLGDGTSGNGNMRLTPMHLQDASFGSLVSVSAGGDFVLALNAEGEVWSWGYNTWGELGDGTTMDRATPQKVAGLPEIKAIFAGSNTSFAIARDGTVWGWGRNERGMLGDGTTIDRLVPTQIPALTGVTQISTGGWMTLALKADGTVLSFGDNGSTGYLGRGTPNQIYPTPGLVKGAGGTGVLSGVVGISTSQSVGYHHSLAVKADGTAWAWGDGCCGQLGNGSSADRAYPTQVSNLTGVTHVSAGGYFSLARLSSGQVWSWGMNFNGELGNSGAWVYEFKPVQVQNITNATVLVAGGNHSIVLTSDGKSRTWGGNWYGAVGDGTTADRVNPYQIPSFTLTKPATPTDLTAAPGEELAYLAFKPPSSVVNQYVVTPYAGGVAQPDLDTQSTHPSFAVRNLTQGATYSFTVAARNCLGASAATPRSDRVVPTGVQLGEKGFKIEGTELTDRLSLKVNAFNGNLALHASDLRVAGTGLDLAVTRTYNNRSTDTSSPWGARWAASVGDVRLEFLSGGSVFYRAPGGAMLGFAKEDDGTYSAPPPVSATLTFSDGGTPTVTSDDRYTLKENVTYETLVFDGTSGKLLSARDRNANEMTYTYAGPSGRLSAITDTQGRMTTFSYDASGRVSQITDPASRTWAFTYDASGNLTSHTDPAGGVTQLGYEGAGNLTQITTPAGRRVEVAYDASRRVTSLKWPLQAGTPTTSFSYSVLSPRENQTVVTDASGNPTTYTFDPVGNTTGVTDALGNATSLDYTSRQNVKTYRSAGGGTTSFGYTSVNGLNSVHAPTGAENELAYGDPNHPLLPTKVTDAQGNDTLFAYDLAGNLVSAQNELPAQNKVEISHGSDGAVTSVKDPRGSTTTNTYDAAGNLTKTTPPAPLGEIQAAYDSVSRVTSITDGEGQVTTFTYDPLDRVTRITYDDGSSVSYAYDPDGNLLRMTDPTGTTYMTYDAMGRIASRQTPGDAGGPVRYTYDGVGNLTQISYRDTPSFEVRYTYTATNLPDKVLANAVDWGGVSEIASFSYDADYNRTQVAYPSGLLQTFAYDEAGRTTKVAVLKGTQTLRSFEYSYDKGGSDTALRQKMTEKVGSKTRVTTYTYDALNRLVEADGSDWGRKWTYTYDGASSRLTETLVLANDPARPETLVQQGVFNAAGELTSLTEIAQDTYPLGLPASSKVETFAYDGNGNRTTASDGPDFTYAASGQTEAMGDTTFTYRGTGQTERATRRAPCSLEPCTTNFLDTALGLTGERRGAEHAVYVRDPWGTLLLQRSLTSEQALERDAGADTTAFSDHTFLLDGVGSVIALGDQSAALVATFAYDPFGELIESTGETGLTPFGFAGAYRDPTGLLKIGERYYDPSLGRFTQPDPVHDPLDPKLWNRYVYVGDDPINFVDPTGLSWQSKLKCIGSNIANGIADFISGRSGDAGSATGALWFGAGVLSGSGVRMIYIAAVLGSGGWVIVGTIALLGGATLGFIALYRDVASCWD